MALDIQQQVYDLLAHATNISFISSDQEAVRQTGLSPGQRVSAEVINTMLPGNRTQVRIGADQYSLELPMTVRQGQILEMTYVTQDPRATFAIARQGGTTPPVSLSDASRLLGLLIGSEQIGDPRLRSSLQSISDILRRSSGDTGILANLMDEAVTYGRTLPQAVKGAPPSSGDFLQQEGESRSGVQYRGAGSTTADQARLAAFEANASRLLQQIARSSRFFMVEATNQLTVPLPLSPGQEVDALVTGVLPGGRVFAQVAGVPLEFQLQRGVAAGERLRMTFLSALPRPLFAVSRQVDLPPGVLSEAGRWLSLLEHSEGPLPEQQLFVLNRLNQILKSLPPDSSALAAIRDQVLIYEAQGQLRGSEKTGVASAGQPAAGTPASLNLADDMALLLQALIKGDRLALLEARGSSALPGLVPGQQLRGEVISALGGGRFMVLVAGQATEFLLPKGVTRGDALNLYFITSEPTGTFLLVRKGAGSDARVSETGRWLSGFLAATADQHPVGETLGIIRILLGASAGSAEELSRLLQQGLRESGLFYESHLARWFEGRYRLEDLLAEPQGRLSLRLNPVEPQMQSPCAETEHLPPGSITADLLEAVLAQAGTDRHHETIADQRTLGVVREQLNLLESGRLAFRGEIYPGQPFQLSVAEQEEERAKNGSRERSWHSNLSITLPRLGTINASIVLNRGMVQIGMTAERGPSVERLTLNKPQLVEHLAAAGISPGRIEVSHAPG